MNRKTFLELSALFGIGLSAPSSLLASCKSDENLLGNEETFLIIGAGFAGEAYTDGEDWCGAHAAALAAKCVVDQLT